MSTAADFKYYLWDLNTKWVLCETSSRAAVHAASEGILNSLIFVSFGSDVEKSDFLIMDLFKGGKIVPATTTPSEKDLKLIKLAKLRTQYLHRLEVLLEKYIHTYCSPLNDGVNNYLSTLSLGEDFNTSHPLVVEYSGILGISNTEGYNDLKMRFDSYGLLKIKAFAFFEKFKKQINACYSEQEAISILEQTKYELYTASQI